MKKSLRFLFASLIFFAGVIVYILIDWRLDELTGTGLPIAGAYILGWCASALFCFVVDEKTNVSVTINETKSNEQNK